MELSWTPPAPPILSLQFHQLSNMTNSEATRNLQEEVEHSLSESDDLSNNDNVICWLFGW